MDDKGVADDFADGDGGDFAVDLHQPAHLGEVVEQGEEGLGGVELLLGEEGVLGVLPCGVRAEEVVHRRDVCGRHRAVRRLRVGPAELRDVVALAREAPPWILHEVGEVVEVVAPRARVRDGHVAPVAPGEQGEALGGDGAEDERDALGHAPRLHRRERPHLRALVGLRVDRVGEADLAAIGRAQEQAPLRLGQRRVRVRPPHQQEAQRIVRQAERVALHVTAQGRELTRVQGTELHRSLLVGRFGRPANGSGRFP